VLTVSVLSSWGLAGLGQESIEELVLGALQAGDLPEDPGPMSLHGIGVALGVLVLAVRQRGLGHQRAEPGVVRGLGERRELLVGYRQLFAELTEARTDVGEAALDEGPGHGRQRTAIRSATRI